MDVDTQCVEDSPLVSHLTGVSEMHCTSMVLLFLLAESNSSLVELEGLPEPNSTHFVTHHSVAIFLEAAELTEKRPLV